jgi:hypothetical protein
MLRLDQYESVSPRVNRLLWLTDRIGAFARRVLPTPHRVVLPPEKVRRILLLRCDGIGDLICSIPAIQAICSRYAAARVDLVVGPWNVSLAGMIEGPSSVIAHAPWGYRMLRSDRNGYGFGEDFRIMKQFRKAALRYGH